MTKNAQQKPIEISFSLNENKEVIPIYPEIFDPKKKMKQLQEFYVDNELKKFGYSEQSVAKSLSAFKNGQEKGSPSVRTVGVYQKMQEALKKGQKVKVVIREVKGNQTPKEKCDKELEKYKSKNGNKYPEWNKKKNNDKWIKNK